MQKADYPSLYIAADAAAQKAQKYYINLLRADLILMLFGALLSVYNFQCDNPRIFINILSGIVILIAFILTFVVKIQKYEDLWYQGRALAESVKTLTWRYVTCSENFESQLQQSMVDTKFIQNIDDLSRKFSALSKWLDSRILTSPVITSEAKAIRSLNWEGRKSHYLKHRIKDQKEWYSNKSAFNARRENFWFWGIITFQFLSICASMLLIIFPITNWNLVGLFTAFATTGMAWLQLKQYQELRQAYGVATQELNSIENLASYINSESDLVKFVLDSENAISREHTLWRAQRRM